ncbi:toxin YdaT family protein [Phytobacter sp. V91]|uniref:toxin YdaT family protein n=1 Tax=Phytobacter sp. V91 TaxID=3369425 RepID=UPI003F5D68F7
MQTIGLNQLNQRAPVSLKSKNQIEPRRRDNLKRMAINTAVSEWEKTLPGQAQEKIARLVDEEWQRTGGRGITVNKMNLFRYLRNENGSEKYNRYVMQLAPAISAVMPIEIARAYGLRSGKTEAELVAAAIKECAEAHQAKLHGAPLQRLEKEIWEAATSLYAMLPKEISEPALALLSTLAPQCF